MLNKAIKFAVEAHIDVPRKGTNTPYILHPMEAAVIVGSMTNDNELIAAAVLHDTVEDCKTVSIEDIKREFGERIAVLVGAETENKEKSWKERKEFTLDYLKTKASYEEKIITLGDKLSNMRAIHRDYNAIGDELWQRFTEKRKEEQGWYYKGIAKALIELKDFPAYQEYDDLATKIFG